MEADLGAVTVVASGVAMEAALGLGAVMVVASGVAMMRLRERSQ